MSKRRPTDHTAPPAGGRPTLKHIAFMTGLGVTTVSRALKDAPEISLATRARVQTVARQIGYRPNRAGIRLRTGKTNVIALILNAEEEVMGMTARMAMGMSKVLADSGYHLVIAPYSHASNPMDPVRYVVETGSADGVVFSRTQPDDPRVRYLVEQHFPFATHGRTEMGIVHAYHDFDNERFGLAAARKLADLGRRRIALLAPPSAMTYHMHMRKGLERALAERELDEVAFTTANGDSRLEDLRAAAVTLMRRRTPPDGIVCSSGRAALGLAVGIEQAGFVVGRDVDIVSKQPVNVLPWYRPAIWVVDEDIGLAGRSLARLLLASIEGADPAGLHSIEQPPAVRRQDLAAGIGPDGQGSHRPEPDPATPGQPGSPP